MEVQTNDRTRLSIITFQKFSMSQTNPIDGAPLAKRLKRDAAVRRQSLRDMANLIIEHLQLWSANWKLRDSTAQEKAKIAKNYIMGMLQNHGDCIRDLHLTPLAYQAIINNFYPMAIVLVNDFGHDPFYKLSTNEFGAIRQDPVSHVVGQAFKLKKVPSGIKAVRRRRKRRLEVKRTPEMMADIKAVFSMLMENSFDIPFETICDLLEYKGTELDVELLQLVQEMAHSMIASSAFRRSFGEFSSSFNDERLKGSKALCGRRTIYHLSRRMSIRELNRDMMSVILGFLSTQDLYNMMRI